MRQEPQSAATRVGIAGVGAPTAGLLPQAQPTPQPRLPAAPRRETQMVPRAAAEPEPEGTVEEVVEEYRKRKRLTDDDAQWIQRQLKNFGTTLAQESAYQSGQRFSRYAKLSKRLSEFAASGDLDRGVAQQLIRKLAQRKVEEQKRVAGERAAASLSPVERFFIGARTAAEDVSRSNIFPTITGGRLASSQGGPPLAEVVPPEVLGTRAAEYGQIAGGVGPALGEGVAGAIVGGLAAGPVGAIIGAGLGGATQAAGGQISRREAQNRQLAQAQSDFNKANAAYKADPSPANEDRLREAATILKRRSDNLTSIPQAIRQAAGATAAAALSGIGGPLTRLAGKAIGRVAPKVAAAVPAEVAKVAIPEAIGIAANVGAAAAQTAIAEGRLPTAQELGVAGGFSALLAFAGARRYARVRGERLQGEADFLEHMLKTNSIVPEDVAKVEAELAKVRRKLTKTPAPEAKAPAAPKAPKAPKAPAAGAKPQAKPPSAGPREWTGAELLAPARTELPKVGDTMDVPDADGNTVRYIITDTDAKGREVAAYRADDQTQTRYLFRTNPEETSSPLAMHTRALKKPLEGPAIDETKAVKFADIVGEGRQPKAGDVLDLRRATGAALRVQVGQEPAKDGVLKVVDKQGNEYNLRLDADDPAALTPGDLEPIARKTEAQKAPPAGKVEEPTPASVGKVFVFKKKPTEKNPNPTAGYVVIERVDPATGETVYRYANQPPGKDVKTVKRGYFAENNDEFFEFQPAKAETSAFAAAADPAEKAKAAKAALERLDEAEADIKEDIALQGRRVSYESEGQLFGVQEARRQLEAEITPDIRAEINKLDVEGVRQTVAQAPDAEFAAKYDPAAYQGSDADTVKNAAEKFQRGVDSTAARILADIEANPAVQAAPEGPQRDAISSTLIKQALTGIKDASPLFKNSVRAAIAATKKGAKQQTRDAAKAAKEAERAAKQAETEAKKAAQAQAKAEAKKAKSETPAAPAAETPDENVYVLPALGKQPQKRVKYLRTEKGKLVLQEVDAAGNPVGAAPTYVNSGSKAGLELARQRREGPLPFVETPPVAAAETTPAGEPPKASKRAAPGIITSLDFDAAVKGLSDADRWDFARALDGDEGAASRIKAKGLADKYQTYSREVFDTDGLFGQESKLAKGKRPAEPEPADLKQLRDVLAGFSKAKTQDELGAAEEAADAFLKSLEEPRRKELRQQVYAAGEAASAKIEGEPPAAPGKGTIAGAIAAAGATLGTALPAKAATLSFVPEAVGAIQQVGDYLASNPSMALAGIALGTIAKGAMTASKRAGGFAAFFREFSKQPEIAAYLKNLKTEKEKLDFLKGTQAEWRTMVAKAAHYSRAAFGATGASERYFIRTLGEEMAEKRGLTGADREDFLTYFEDGLRGMVKSAVKQKIDPMRRKAVERLNIVAAGDQREPGFVGREWLSLVGGKAAQSPELANYTKGIETLRRVESQLISKYATYLNDVFPERFWQNTTKDRERLAQFFQTAVNDMTPVERQKYADFLDDENLMQMRADLDQFGDELVKLGLLSEGARNEYRGRFLQTFGTDQRGFRRIFDAVLNLGTIGPEKGSARATVRAARAGKLKTEYRGVTNTETGGPRFGSPEARAEWVAERNKNWNIDSQYEINGEPYVTLTTLGGDRVENVLASDLPNWNIEGRGRKWRAVDSPRDADKFKAVRDVTDEERADLDFVQNGARDVLATLRNASRDKERGAVGAAIAADSEMAVTDRTSDRMQQPWNQRRYGRNNELGVVEILDEDANGNLEVRPLDGTKPDTKVSPRELTEFSRNESTQEFEASNKFVPAVMYAGKKWDVVDVTVKGRLKKATYKLKRGDQIIENIPEEDVRKFRLLSVPAEVRANGIGAFKPGEFNYGKLNDTFVSPDAYALMQSLTYPSRLKSFADLYNNSILGNRVLKLGSVALNTASLANQIGQNLFTLGQQGVSLFELPEHVMRFVEDRDLVASLEQMGLFADMGSVEMAGVQGGARTKTFKEYSPNMLFMREFKKSMDAVRAKGEEPTMADVIKALGTATVQQGSKQLTRYLPAAIQFQDAVARFALQRRFEQDYVARGMDIADARARAVDMAREVSYTSNPNPVMSLLSKTTAPFASVWHYNTFVQPVQSLVNPVGFLLTKLTMLAGAAALGAVNEDERRVLTIDGKEETRSLRAMQEELSKALSPTGVENVSFTGVPDKVRFGEYILETGKFDPGRTRRGLFGLPGAVLPESGGTSRAILEAIPEISDAVAGKPASLRRAVRALSFQNERFAIPETIATPVSDDVDAAVRSLSQVYLPTPARVGKVFEPGKKQDFSRWLAAVQVLLPVAKYKPELLKSRVEAWGRGQQMALSRAKGRELSEIENVPANRAKRKEIADKYDKMAQIVGAQIKRLSIIANELVIAERERKGLVMPAAK